MGHRIADQVRRALILAAKVAPVAVVIDASGCGCHACAGDGGPPCDPTPSTGYCGTGGYNPGGSVSRDAGPLIFQAGAGGVGGTMGMGLDAGGDARDAGKDAR